MKQHLFLCVVVCWMAGTARVEEPITHRVLGCDKGKAVILGADGKVEWEYPVKFGGMHDVSQLSNGNFLLHTGPATVEEITPEKKSIWKYTATPGTAKGRVEIHAFQRLRDGNTLIAESGNGRLVEVNSEGKIVKEITLKIDHPSPHRDTRLVRKLSTGNYLVCHEGDGVVREYNPEGKVVWSYKLELGDRKPNGDHGPNGYGVNLFSAVRLPSGNTLIGAGNNHRVLEVNPKGEIVWSIDQKELPGIVLAWVTTIQVLPSGNVVIGNTHAGADNPQLIEVTRDKKVVWTLKDHKTFGNDLAAAQILTPAGALR
jgi:hypothetical protein